MTPDIAEELKAYAEGAVADPETHCRKHRWACQRFLSDLHKSRTDPEYPYTFDSGKAEHFFAWTRLFKHIDGTVAGKKIELVPIQRFLTGQLFGWIHKETGHRRFSKFYWQVARKNAKSETMALILTYLCFADGESAGQIFCVATKRDQARVVYDVCEKFVRQALPPKVYKIAYHQIDHLKSGSYIRALSKEDRKKGDGYNPHGVSVDEYHAHDTTEFYDVMWSGMGARNQPVHATITTAGSNLDYPCYRVEYQMVSRILDPNVDFVLDNYLCTVNELDKNEEGEVIDDISKVESWIKANPIVTTYARGIKGLQDSYNEALGVPEKMRDFLTKRMNIWVNMPECGYMDIEKWKLCESKTPIYTGRYRLMDTLKGVPCFAGVDLSAKIDLTSVGFIWLKDDIYYIYSHSFIPEETLHKKEKTDKVPYMMWAKAGYITITPGAVVDYRAVKSFITDRRQKSGWKIAEVCLDPWGSIQIANDLIEEGFEVLEVIQGPKTLSEPTKDFRNMVYSKRVAYNYNPLLSWCMSHAVVDVVDRTENIILNKAKSTQRIDPVAALINAHVRAMNSEIKAPPTVRFI